MYLQEKYFFFFVWMSVIRVFGVHITKKCHLETGKKTNWKLWFFCYAVNGVDIENVFKNCLCVIKSNQIKYTQSVIQSVSFYLFWIMKMWVKIIFCLIVSTVAVVVIIYFHLFIYWLARYGFSYLIKVFF